MFWLDAKALGNPGDVAEDFLETPPRFAYFRSMHSRHLSPLQT
jgi:hypothetical protein